MIIKSAALRQRNEARQLQQFSNLFNEFDDLYRRLFFYDK
jgi:hypothetical protein